MTASSTTRTSTERATASPALPVVSCSPHEHEGSSVRRIMLDVVLATVPAMAVAVATFGWDAVRLLVACVSACVLGEAAARKCMGRDLGISDGSAIVTGILLAFNLPPALPTAMAILGALVAIVVAKQIFGGLGFNPFNPALVGRAFLLISFPVHMTTWTAWVVPNPMPGTDAVTTATPLGRWKTSVQSPMEVEVSTAGDGSQRTEQLFRDLTNQLQRRGRMTLSSGGPWILNLTTEQDGKAVGLSYQLLRRSDGKVCAAGKMQDVDAQRLARSVASEVLHAAKVPFRVDRTTAWAFFWGRKNGCLGEVSGLSIVLGAAYLFVRRCIDWRIPGAFLATVGALGLVWWLMDPVLHMPPLFHWLTGGLLLGAFFMATDMVTSPVTRSGRLIFGAGCGLLTFVIRQWGGYPEGVSFAILIMNSLTPLLNRLTRPRVFGHGRGRTPRRA